jgi:hypothetical protein
MSTIASGIGGHRAAMCKTWRERVALAFCAAVGLATGGVPALAQAQFSPQVTRTAQVPGPVTPQTADREKIPQLSGPDLGWISAGGFLDPPTGTGHGPIRQDPAYPFHGNLDGPGQVTPTIGNTHDPILKPWAAAQMRAGNEEVLDGKRGLPFSAQGRCYPGGVPGQLLYPIEPMYFIQTPDEVWMIWQRDHMVRRIYLTDHHAAVVKPSWFGESIGHYENGDTLVVDTIGLQTRLSYIDNYRTPHSEREHVIERYKVSADGRTLQADITIEDPDTFTAPLQMIKRWRRANNPRLETVCAENNGDLFSRNLFPIPTAATPDF